MNVGVGIYVKNSAKAVEFYTKVLGLELGYHVKNEDGSYYHSELCKDGKQIISVVEGEGSNEKSIVQLGIEFDTPDEVKCVYEQFCADGAEVDMSLGELPWTPCAASVIDKFGVWWYFSAQSHYPGEDFDPKEPLRS